MKTATVMADRAPSDRNAMWAYWRAARESPPLVVPAEPQLGLYKMRHFGRWVGVQIDLAQDADPETGELLADEGPHAWRNGAPCDADDAWHRCAEFPIERAEFERLQNAPRVRDLSREVIT